MFVKVKTISIYFSNKSNNVVYLKNTEEIKNFWNQL